MPRPLALVAGLVLLAVAPPLAGCGSRPKPPPPDLADPSLEVARLLDVLWEWETTILPLEDREVADPSRYTLRFQAGDRVFVRADCNRGSASYELDPAEHGISIAPGPMTRMGCPPDSRDFVFMKELQGVTNWRFEGEKLMLQLGDTEATMRFRPARPEGQR